MNLIFNPEAAKATERPQRTACESFRTVARVGRVIPNAPLQAAFGRRIKDNPPYLGMTV